ncbi:MAG: hypothetical protein J2P17_17065 [Mycobacterium sp.]|nr:hypothetical protein [Mycobacterium sp.]
MISETRDLLEDRNGVYPAHIRIMDIDDERTNLAAYLWLGNENSGTAVDVLLTHEDLEWIIHALQKAVDKTK